MALRQNREIGKAAWLTTEVASFPLSKNCILLTPDVAALLITKNPKP